MLIVAIFTSRGAPKKLANQKIVKMKESTISKEGTARRINHSTSYLKRFLQNKYTKFTKVHLWTFHNQEDYAMKLFRNVSKY